MKTVMQNIIDYLQEMLDDDFDSRTKYIQEHCIKALDEEKNQIIEAVTFGQNNHSVSIPYDLVIATDYAETFLK